ncbi:type IV pilus modification protein PilV [Acidovorax radicis]|uniref:type IV pilus modification protein PilV n=1 Tax=Acidovorax radicis TaxID=758826 RepID=UPI0002377104|nr:type IV pilus modification protein PilV [Acidovorax radicis]
MKNKQILKQQGFSLMESLVSIVIMALGILGILGVQMRTLADTQNGVRRAQAIRLIENLSEKIKVNPNPLAATVLATYQVSTPGPMATPPACTAACTPAQLAQHDIANWKQQVINTLPAGDAVVFVADDETDPNNRKQLGILVSWQQKEKETTGSFITPFITSNSGAISGPISAVSCPVNKICHLQYIQVVGRCQQDISGGPVALMTWCPYARSELP